MSAGFMRILHVLPKTVAIVLAGLNLAGCPTQFNVEVLNDSSSTIHILSGYSDLELSRIEPGEATQVAYNLDCFRVRAGELIYEYKPVMPPAQYVQNGLFSSLFKAVFTGAQELKIYVDGEKQNESLYLVKGCK
ncbi:MULTISPECIES: hypothetical protein [unclassified Shewanella]|uniref:hypothetical protein n=1 Tax=Shewanella TaxID=22 RepID=UPI000903DD26|nr:MULTISPECIES: hypothetical protein [unclassified Shewanella]MCU8002296.1 hypothetical protein [Shewanella sp. SM96]MCU8061173.1 hypothetical protein [Shewanella sp. SM55]OUS52559.1 hypothetical protein BM607_001050 [Shewanella sp. SACH]